MLTRLIESRYRFVRTDLSTAASVAIHLILITLAAYFTTATAMIEKGEDTTEILHFISPRPTLIASPSHSQSRAAQSSDAVIPRLRSVSFSVPTDIPAIDVTFASTSDSDFPSTSPWNGISESQYAGPAQPRTAYEEVEVDAPASSLANQPTPAYPPSMRAAGVEGKVFARFLVNSDGLVSRESIRIVSSTNELFSEAVRDAIAKMRFAPARIGSKAVAQMVQQVFIFRLDR